MIFLVNTGSLNMVGNYVKGNLLMRGETYNLDHLQEVKEDLKVCINNPAILDYISTATGISLVNNINRVSLQPGDILLRIKPSAGVKDYKTDEPIPTGAVTFTLEEWISCK